MSLDDFKKLIRKGIGYGDDKPLTSDELLLWQGINFNEFLSKQTQVPSQVTVKDQDNNVVATVNAPGQVSVFTFDGIQDLALAGNLHNIIDSPLP